MNREFSWRKWLRVAGWTVGGVCLLLVVCLLLLNTRPVQNWLARQALEMLSAKLDTRVSLDNVSIDLLTQDVRLHGLAVDDRQQRPLLRVEQLVANVELSSLLHHRVRITDARLIGARALLVRADSDSVPNYAFVIDAFKSGEEPSGGTPLTLDMDRVTLERVAVKYNDDEASVGKLDCRLHGMASLPTLRGEALSVRWTRPNRKGVLVTRTASLGTVHLDDGKLDIDGLRFVTDNRLPRKNTGKPHRGFFDADHLDVTASMRWVIDHTGPDSIHAVLRECSAVDSVTGIDLRAVRCALAVTPKALTFTDVYVRQGDTEVSLDRGVLSLPDSVSGQPLTYRTSPISVRAVLKSISRPFAPILKDFTLPLHVSVVMTGDNDRINFSNIVVNTADKQFLLHAAGWVGGISLHDSHEIKVHFDVNNMTARPAVIENILKQFPFKRFMMKQLNNLGTVQYTGAFDVLWKKEIFGGRVLTRHGDVNFNMTVDGLNKYMLGHISAPSLEVGQVLGMPDVGDTGLTADFKFDIDGKRTAAIRAGRGGKLPIGEVTARVDKAAYKFIHVNNVDVHIESDGSVATGSLVDPHKYMDVSCSFTFTDTDNLHHLSVTPGISFHGARKDNTVNLAKEKDAERKKKAAEKAAKKK